MRGGQQGETADRGSRALPGRDQARRRWRAAPKSMIRAGPTGAAGWPRAGRPRRSRWRCRRRPDGRTVRTAATNLAGGEAHAPPEREQAQPARELYDRLVGHSGPPAGQIVDVVTGARGGSSQSSFLHQRRDLAPGSSQHVVELGLGSIGAIVADTCRGSRRPGLGGGVKSRRPGPAARWPARRAASGRRRAGLQQRLGRAVGSASTTGRTRRWRRDRRGQDDLGAPERHGRDVLRRAGRAEVERARDEPYS